jgi:anthranilate phosphoribosyltransferase
MAEAVVKAKETIDSGKAIETLDRFVAATNKYAELSA